MPGNSQEAVPYRKPREGVHEQAAGHTDPHSALGTGALAGVLAAKAAMERHDLGGTLVFFGEPAEKVCGSKPVHAAHGYYDDLDAAISFHPAWVPSRANTAYWDTHCGCVLERGLHLRVPPSRRPGRPPAVRSAIEPPHIGPRAGRDRRGLS